MNRTIIKPREFTASDDDNVHIYAYRAHGLGQQHLSHAWIVQAQPHVRAFFSNGGFIHGTELAEKISEMLLNGYSVQIETHNALIDTIWITPPGHDEIESSVTERPSK